MSLCCHGDVMVLPFLGTVVHKLLHPENILSLRCYGIKLLILFMLAVQDAADKTCLELFAGAVPGFPPPLLAEGKQNDKSSSSVTAHLGSYSLGETGSTTWFDAAPGLGEGSTAYTVTYAATHRVGASMGSTQCKLCCKHVCWYAHKSFMVNGSGVVSRGCQALFVHGYLWLVQLVYPCAPRAGGAELPRIKPIYPETNPALLKAPRTKHLTEVLLQAITSQVGRLQWADPSHNIRGFAHLFHQFTLHYLIPLYGWPTDTLYPRWEGEPLSPSGAGPRYDTNSPLYHEVKYQVLDRVLKWLCLSSCELAASLPSLEDLPLSTSLGSSFPAQVDGVELIRQTLLSTAANVQLLLEMFRQVSGLGGLLCESDVTHSMSSLPTAYCPSRALSSPFTTESPSGWFSFTSSGSRWVWGNTWPTVASDGASRYLSLQTHPLSCGSRTQSPMKRTVCLGSR